MSDQEPPQMPQIPPKQNKIVIHVVLDPNNGQISVSGPINDKSLCVNILADALKAIVNQRQQVIVPAPGGSVPRNGN